MRVFKFGGASIKNAEAVKNVLQLPHHTGYEDTFIVVSAMGKTTNALERITNGKKLLLEQRTATTLQYVFEAAS